MRVCSKICVYAVKYVCSANISAYLVIVSVCCKNMRVYYKNLSVNKRYLTTKKLYRLLSLLKSTIRSSYNFWTSLTY